MVQDVLLDAVFGDDDAESGLIGKYIRRRIGMICQHFKDFYDNW